MTHESRRGIGQASAKWVDGLEFSFHPRNGKQVDVLIQPALVQAGLVQAGSTQPALRVAIQGELGSNSHMAALDLMATHGREVTIVPCVVSAEVVERLVGGEVEVAVLPIENSLHGSVAEHYDLLLQNPVRIVCEGLLRIQFHLISMPGVRVADLRRVLSHPVALAQCRRFLAAHRDLQVVPYYDTAGSVKHLMEAGLRDTAGIAPELAAMQYGGEILERDLEDHVENFTRFQVVCRQDELLEVSSVINKMTVAFSVEHRPGSLVEVLLLLSGSGRGTGVDLTRIESRPVPGKPWQYIFYVEFKFRNVEETEAVLEALRRRCGMVKELGRYVGV